MFLQAPSSGVLTQDWGSEMGILKKFFFKGNFSSWMIFLCWCLLPLNQISLRPNQGAINNCIHSLPAQLILWRSIINASLFTPTIMYLISFFKCVQFSITACVVCTSNTCSYHVSASQFSDLTDSTDSCCWRIQSGKCSIWEIETLHFWGRAACSPLWLATVIIGHLLHLWVNG